MKLAMSVIAALAVATAAFAQEAPQRHFVVMITGGEKFAELQNHPDLLKTHRAIYLDFARKCWTLAGGLLEGEAPVGVTIFAIGVDEAKIKTLVEADPAVIGGYLGIEYRTLEIRMGALPRARAECKPT